MAEDKKPEAKKKTEADTNNDELLTEEEVRKYNEKNPDDPMADPFTVEAARAEYGYTVAVIDSDPKLQELFEEAVRQEWSAERFKVAVKNWARDAGYETASALAAYKQEQEGGEPWERSLENARQEIKNSAVNLGIPVDSLGLDTEAGKEMVRRWVYGGYKNRSQEAVVSFLAPGGVEGTTGAIDDTLDSLRSLAINNGVEFSDGWYKQVADSIALNNTDKNYWEQTIRDQAAQRFPVFGEKIKAGISVNELASPYTSAMRRVLERGDVSLDDPWISKALNGVAEDGTPKAMTLYEFETALRQSSEWQNTTNGKNTLLNTGQKFLRDLGFLSNDPGSVV